MIQNGYHLAVKTRVDRTGLAIALGALVLRLTPWKAVFSPAGTLFVDVDDWNHLRRMLVAARNFPLLPVLDRHFAHPDGFLTNWPPFHDWLAGGLIRFAWMFSPGLETAAAVAAFIPVFFGAVSIYLLHGWVKTMLPSKLAVFAAVLAAVLPSPLFYSVLGRPDHHCSEVFWFLLGVTLIRSPSYAALALSAGWLSWSGFAAFELILFLWMCWEVRSKRAVDPNVFLYQVPILLLFTIANPFVTAGNVDFDLPSLFQPWSCVFFFAALEGLRRRSWAWAAAAGAAGLPLLWLVLPSIGRFAGTPPRVFYLFTELQPLFKPYGRWDLLAAGPWLGLMPFAVPFLFWDFYRRRTAVPEGRLAFLFALSFAVLACLQTRYVMHFSFAAAVLIASSLDYTKRFKAAVAVAVLLLMPALKNSAALPFAGAQLTGNPEIREACEWIRTNTPPTKSAYRDEGVPEYGVFADSNLAPMVAALAERPAAGANNHAMKDQLGSTIQLFLRDDGAKVAAELKSKGFRYVLLDSMNDGGRYFTYLGLTALPQDKWEMKRGMTVFYRLYNEKPDADLKKAFRLVHETPSGAYKIFEVIR